MKIKLLTICLLLIILLSGCETIYKQDMRDSNILSPVEETSEYIIYRFQSYADIIQRVDSEKAEHRRITDLERRLEINGHDIMKYEILKRITVLRQKTYDIFYDVRVSK